MMMMMIKSNGTSNVPVYVEKKGSQIIKIGLAN
jgi:hypothetical protein